MKYRILKLPETSHPLAWVGAFWPGTIAAIPTEAEKNLQEWGPSFQAILIHQGNMEKSLQGIIDRQYATVAPAFCFNDTDAGHPHAKQIIKNLEIEV